MDGRLYLLQGSGRDSKYYGLATHLWKEYMPSLRSGMSFDMFERLMSQRPDVVDAPEVIWGDLVDSGNLREIS